jgi:hypothetical protein
MRKYVLKILLFSFPMFLPLIFIVIIDPYNFFNISKIIDDETKVNVMNGSVQSFTRGNMLWKVLKFRRKPCPNLIIGDSDGFHIHEQLVSKLTGEEYFNFSISGANIETQIKIFWFAAERIKLRKVFLQLTFELCNQNISYNLFHFAQDYIDKPYLYFANKEIFLDSFRNLISEISNNSDWVDHTYVIGSREEMIKSITGNAERFLKNYAYPEKFLSELKQISDYCVNHNVELRFIIFPSSNLVNEQFIKYNMLQMREQFYDEISSLAATYNFLSAYRNFSDINNFQDFAHTTQHVTDSMTVEIWKPKTENNIPHSE